MNSALPVLLAGPTTGYVPILPDMAAAVLFGLFVGSALVLYWHRRQVSRLSLEHELEMEALKQKQAELQILLQNTEQDVIQMKSDLEDHSRMKVSMQSDALPESLPEPEREKNNRTFYMPQPNRNGRFLESGRHSSLESAIYAFHIDPANPSAASFEFVAKDIYLKVALGNEPTWINIACDRDNQPGIATTLVQTLTPGQAVLRGVEWEITRKAQITYL